MIPTYCGPQPHEYLVSLYYLTITLATVSPIMPNEIQLAATNAVAIANSGFWIRIDKPTASVIIIIIRWIQITYYYYYYCYPNTQGQRTHHEIYYVIYSQPQRNSIYDWIPTL